MRVLKVLAVVLAAGLAVTPLPRGLVERVYARGVYPFLQPRLTALSNAMPFALFDVVLIAIVGALVALWVLRVRNAKRARGVLAALPRIALDTVAIAAVVYLWFLASWGLNYQREPLRAQLDFREERITPEALRGLAGRTVSELNALHADAHARGWPDAASTPVELEAAFASAQRDLALSWTARPGRPKRTLLNFYFTRVSIDGMTDPFFLETLTNQSLLPFERAATLAHEWSHLAGYADESEASFVGWLVCMRGSSAIQYSGWLSLYGTVMSALPRSEREDMVLGLNEGPRNDLRAIGDRIRSQMSPAASRAGYAMYDKFLKANRVEAGVRSYGEVLRLLLGTRFEDDRTPALRRGKG